MAFCENCGNKVSVNAKFCPKCGNELKSSGNTQSSEHTVTYQSDSYLNVPKRKFGYGKYVLIVIVLLIAFITKPSFYNHKNSILNEVLIPIVDKAGSEAGINDLSSISFLGFNMRKELKEYIDNSEEITYKSYLFISTVEYDSQPISYGAFGIVFIPPQVKNEMNRQVKEMVEGAKLLLKSDEDVPSNDDDSNWNTKNDQSPTNDELPPMQSFN